MLGFRSYSISSHQTLHSTYTAATLEESAASEKHQRNKAFLRIKPSSPAGAKNLTLLNNFPHLQYCQAWPRYKHI